MNSEFFETQLFSWVFLPLIIFLARIIDVSIGTVRIMFVSKGYRKIAPVLGFFEVLVWILVMSQIIQNLTNPMTYIAFALGFSTGTYIGMKIEQKLSLGNVVLRIITRKSGQELVEALSKQGLGVTSIDGIGKYGPVNIIFTVVNKKFAPQVIDVVKSYNPKAFYTIEPVEKVSNGSGLSMDKKPGLFSIRGLRKSK